MNETNPTINIINLIHFTTVIFLQLQMVLPWI